MPYVAPGAPEPQWITRRQRREALSQRLFGRPVAIMLGAVFLILGGLCIGAAIVDAAHSGWSFHAIANAGYAVVPLAVGFVLLRG